MNHDVFISFCRKDVRIAKALYRALCRYQVPSTFVDEVKDDVTVRHIDKFAVCPLNNQCDESVENSDCLVVLCSHDSIMAGAQEECKINACVKRFIALGRKDRIIPVVIDDTSDVAANPIVIPRVITDAKIPLVRLDERNRRGFRQTLLTVICRILNLQPDQAERLIVFDNNFRRHRRYIALGILGVLLAGTFFIDSERTVVRYYSNYVDSYGLPEGIFPLDASELEHRNVHYRFEYEGFQFGSSPHADSAGWCIWNLVGIRRQLVRVVQANSHGYPVKSQHPEHASHPEIQDFQYDGGRLCKIGMFHHSRDEAMPECEGSVLLSNLLPRNALQAFGRDHEIVNGFLCFSGPCGNPANFDGCHIEEMLSAVDRLAGISRRFVCRDTDGRAEKGLFFNCFLNNVQDGNGVYGFQSKFDSMGRPTEIRFLGRKSGVIACKADFHGVDGLRFQYEERNLRKIEYLGQCQSATNSLNDRMICVFDYDSFGNNIWCRVINGSGEMVCGNDEINPCGKGNAGFDAEYDSFGNMIRLSFVRTSDELGDSVSRCTEIRREYDEFGNMVKESFLGADGRLVLCEEGFATIVWAFEGYGNPIKVSYLGLDDKLTLHKDGNAGLIYHTNSDSSSSMEAFDTKECSVSPCLVAVVSDVSPGLSAEKSGIRQGDIVCKFNMYDMLEAENACEVFAPIRASKKRRKEIVLARKVGADYEIHRYSFPAGMIGMGTDVKYIYDHEKLARAYKTFHSREKEKRLSVND